VDPDFAEEDLILAYCRLLASRPELARAMGAAARAYVAREHTLEGAAAGYARFLARRYGWGELPPAREPLWRVETSGERPRTGGAASAEQGRPVSLAQSRAEQQPESEPTVADAPPFALGSVAAAAAELGTTEEDRFVLEAAARAARDLL
jgi:hypothetical protein